MERIPTGKEEKMKLDMVGIITKNMEQALAFYQVLGFTPLGQHSEDYME
ncbi:hypothetical protein HMPREF9087_2979 [Enterococcus casseliflavus ATCC 12755]|uniref:Uncharacterized protein n=1 Tax=Enterococcus casseliflavus ATCC 12755 TaxID=888066 RepID=F0ENI7_ENTCA|nr:hypothetical protein HMPREF9087_2979 [Enterococcus casseliflavus ATCC 12755]